MNKSKYSITENDIKNVKVYGLSILNPENTELNFSYISEFRDDAEKLLDTFTNSDISPVHYKDIVEDHLYELYCEKLKINNIR